MKICSILAITICLAIASISGQTQLASGRVIALTSKMDQAVVPAGRTPVPKLESLSALAGHVGEYPCTTGLLGASAIQAALRSVLGDDYGAYLEHVKVSGCGAIAWRGSLLFMDISQLHVGGHTSLIMINPKTNTMWLMWMPGTVIEKKWKMYGPHPVPAEVSKTAVDGLNVVWGHVASFSWRDGGLVFGPPKAESLPPSQTDPAAK